MIGYQDSISSNITGDIPITVDRSTRYDTMQGWISKRLWNGDIIYLLIAYGYMYFIWHCVCWWAGAMHCQAISRKNVGSRNIFCIACVFHKCLLLMTYWHCVCWWAGALPCQAISSFGSRNIFCIACVFHKCLLLMTSWHCVCWWAGALHCQAISRKNVGSRNIFCIPTFGNRCLSAIGGGKQQSRMAGWVQLSVEAAPGPWPPRSTASATMCREFWSGRCEHRRWCGKFTKNSGAATTLHFSLS